LTGAFRRLGVIGAFGTSVVGACGASRDRHFA
jgi:hypothetical protein